MKGGYLTIGHWHGAPVRIHWTLPIGAFVFGQGRIAPGFWLGFFLVILLHEIGHARLVRRYRHKIVSIDVHGLGGVCHWAGNATPIERARIACGGVNVQVLLLFATVLALSILGPTGTPFGDQLADAFTVGNGWVIALNLLPVHPLDGAEIWKLPGLLRAQSRARMARSAPRGPSEAESELQRMDAADRQGPSRATAEAVEAKLVDLGRPRDDKKPN